MPSYKAPLDTMRFVLHDVLDYPNVIGTLPDYGDMGGDLVDAVLDEAAKLCENVLAPLNLSGDTEGCLFENGVVRTPKGFKQAYESYCEGGWGGLTADPAYGGQGMPHVIGTSLNEMASSANMAFAMYPGLTHGAIDAITQHASDDLKQLYLPKLISGEWSGTMCLTEPHCGTDLGLIRTKAIPAEDGSYKITGTKIFISAGEHDLSGNIIHLVLARMPDAPAGIKGISLFIVPKFLPKNDGVGARNGVSCGSIEHKMGIKGSATCVMNFDESQGWLVGQKHKGMKAMFTMMNAARLGVAIQGLAQGEVSYQNALAYAKDRLQGRALSGTKEPAKAADPILVHPDVRRMLLTMKAFAEGGRALTSWAGMLLDIAAKHPEAEEREAADDLLALLTPILKAYLTDMGFNVTNLGMQVLGGHGYVHEWGMEQFVRDARIAMIYEGANGIQALDLVGRKIPAHTGRYLRRFFHPVGEYLMARAEHPQLGALAAPVAKLFGKLQQATATVAMKGLAKPDEAGAASTDYLHLFALVAMGYMWVRMAETAGKKLAEGANGHSAFYDSKIKTAQFFVERILPQGETHFRALMSGAKNLMQMDAEQF